MRLSSQHTDWSSAWLLSVPISTLSCSAMHLGKPGPWSPLADRLSDGLYPLGTIRTLKDRWREGVIFLLQTCVSIPPAGMENRGLEHCQHLQVDLLLQSLSSSSTWSWYQHGVSPLWTEHQHLWPTSAAQSTSQAFLPPRFWALVTPPSPCCSPTFRDGSFLQQLLGSGLTQSPFFAFSALPSCRATFLY